MGPHFYEGEFGRGAQISFLLIRGLSLKGKSLLVGGPNLRDFNMDLLASWSKRFFDDDRDSDWKRNLCYKYGAAKPSILYGKPCLGSLFWKSISWAFGRAKKKYRWEVGSGRNIYFWHDQWVEEISLKTSF